MSLHLPGERAGNVPKSLLITGGAGALGFAIAQALGTDRKVAILDIGEGVEERAAALPDAIGLSCDLAEPDAIAAAYREAVQSKGPFGVVVHAAAIASVVPFLDTDRALFEQSLTVNLTSAFDIFRMASSDLVAAGLKGRMIAIASISGARAGFGRTAYGVSKAGLIHLVSQMALELGPYGITANVVAPGPVDTPMSRRAHTAEQRADYQRTIPGGRYGTASDVTGAVAYLAGEDADYVSGHTLFVDGGYMASGMGVSIAQSAAQIRGGAAGN